MITVSPIRPLLSLAVAAVSVTGLLTIPATADSLPLSQRPAVSRLVDIRAARHPGIDRLVFEFRGPLPRQRAAWYVNRLVHDPSGRTVTTYGDALLKIRFASAEGHNARGVGTYGPTRRTYPLPGVIQVVNTGDVESVLSFGVGLAKRVPYRMYTLTRPNRVVIDFRTPYRTVPVRTYFLNTHAYRVGREPYTRAVSRWVIPPATAKGALQRLFAGPTQSEQAAGLRLVNSKATGFGKVTIRDRIARVYLTGRCDSGGSTFTIANQIIPTLKQFPSVRWVKIYDAAGRTRRPYGPSDSIPTCLEP